MLLSQIKISSLLLDRIYSRSVSPKGLAAHRLDVAELIQTKLEHGGPPTTMALGFDRSMYCTAWQSPGLGHSMEISAIYLSRYGSIKWSRKIFKKCIYRINTDHIFFDSSIEYAWPGWQINFVSLWLFQFISITAFFGNNSALAIDMWKLRDAEGQATSSNHAWADSSRSRNISSYEVMTKHLSRMRSKGGIGPWKESLINFDLLILPRPQLWLITLNINENRRDLKWFRVVHTLFLRTGRFQGIITYRPGLAGLAATGGNRRIRILLNALEINSKNEFNSEVQTIGFVHTSFSGKEVHCV